MYVYVSPLKIKVNIMSCFERASKQLSHSKATLASEGNVDYSRIAHPIRNALTNELPNGEVTEQSKKSQASTSTVVGAACDQK